MAPELRHYVARRAREEAEVEAIRTRSHTLAASADAVATSGLPRAGGGSADKAGKAGRPARAIRVPPPESLQRVNSSGALGV